MITQRLAEFVIDTRTADVPGDVLDASRDALIDTIGVALVGSLDEVGEITLRYVSDLGGRREATVWGSPLATTTAEAAFANGVCGHALDFDDVHASVHGHPSTTLVPAIIAAGVVMLMQPFSLTLYSWSFATTLFGTVMFIIVSKVRE